jgi:hypothetical protein
MPPVTRRDVAGYFFGLWYKRRYNTAQTGRGRVFLRLVSAGFRVSRFVDITTFRFRHDAAQGANLTGRQMEFGLNVFFLGE